MNNRKTKSQELAAAKAGISERSARRIEGAAALPSQTPRRYWRSRVDPFAAVWDSEMVPLLKGAPNLMAITLLRKLQADHPERLRRLACCARCSATYGSGAPWRAGQGSVLPPGPPARPPRPVGLHRDGRVAHHHRRRAVRPHPVPLRAGLLALGACRGGRRRRELRGPVQGPAERAVAGWRRAAGAPHRQPVGGLQEPGRRRRLHRALHRAARPLRHGRLAQQPRRQP
jgi:hypothetical protein